MGGYGGSFTPALPAASPPPPPNSLLLQAIHSASSFSSASTSSCNSSTDSTSSTSSLYTSRSCAAPCATCGRSLSCFGFAPGEHTTGGDAPDAFCSENCKWTALLGGVRPAKRKFRRSARTRPRTDDVPPGKGNDADGAAPNAPDETLDWDDGDPVFGPAGFAL